MTPDETRARLPLYASGALDEEERESVRAELERSPDLAAELEGFRSLDALLRRALASGSGEVVVKRQCPFCRDDLRAEPFVLCERCLTPHHATCFSENRGCSLLGCHGTRAVGGAGEPTLDVCPRCGERTPAGAPFCAWCRTPLEGGRVPRHVAPAPLRGDSRERLRFVTAAVLLLAGGLATGWFFELRQNVVLAELVRQSRARAREVPGRGPELAFAAGGPVETDVAFIDSRRLVAASRDGNLYLWDADATGGPARIAVGQMGDTLSGVLVVGSRAYVGTVDRGLAAVDLGTRTLLAPPPGAESLFPAEGPVLARPLYARAQNRIVIATAAGQVLGFTPEGGKAVWTRQVEGPIEAPGLIDGEGTVVVAALDEHAHAFDAATGKPAWKDGPCPLGARPVGAPCAVGSTIVVPIGPVEPTIDGAREVRRPGGLVAIDAATGRIRDRWFEPENRGVVAAISDGTRVVIATDDGHVRALDPNAGWRALWSRDWTRPDQTSAPRIAFFGEWVVCAHAEPRLHAIDVRTGEIAWSASLESGSCASPIASKGDCLAVGTTTFDVRVFRRR